MGMNVLVWVFFHAFIRSQILLYDPEYSYTISNALKQKYLQQFYHLIDPFWSVLNSFSSTHSERHSTVCALRRPLWYGNQSILNFYQSVSEILYFIILWNGQTSLKFYNVMHKIFKVCLPILQNYEINGFRDA